MPASLTLLQAVGGP